MLFVTYFVSAVESMNCYECTYFPGKDGTNALGDSACESGPTSAMSKACAGGGVGVCFVSSLWCTLVTINTLSP